MCDIPELCDENGNFVGAIKTPAIKSLACDIPELCDENGNFVGAIKSSATKTLVCDIPELCDENGNFVGASISKSQALKSLWWSGGNAGMGGLEEPDVGGVETGESVEIKSASAPSIEVSQNASTLNMFYGFGQKNNQPQSLVLASDHLNRPGIQSLVQLTKAKNSLKLDSQLKQKS